MKKMVTPIARVGTELKVGCVSRTDCQTSGVIAVGTLKPHQIWCNWLR